MSVLTRYQPWAWFLLSLVISCGNDIIVKMLGMGVSLPGIEVSFLRFFWAACLLLIAFPKTLLSAFYTTNHRIHVGRSFFLCVGMGIWTSFLPLVPLSHATIINFTIPLITLFLGHFLLKEQISSRQYQATALGIIGVTLTLHGIEAHMAWPAAGLFFGAICFASCDVFNKVSGRDDALIPTLFYTALYTAILSAPFAFHVWTPPHSQGLALSALLGFNANILFFCLLKAFQKLQLSQVASLRYLELVFAIAAGFFLFNEHPSVQTLIGGCIVIIGATLAITENKTS